MKTNNKNVIKWTDLSEPFHLMDESQSFLLKFSSAELIVLTKQCCMKYYKVILE